MPKELTATELRANLYRVLKQVHATGVPCRIVSHGRTYALAEVAPKKKRRDLSKLKRRDGALNCTFDELVATTWDHQGNPSS